MIVPPWKKRKVAVLLQITTSSKLCVSGIQNWSILIMSSPSNAYSSQTYYWIFSKCDKRMKDFLYLKFYGEFSQNLNLAKLILGM